MEVCLDDKKQMIMMLKRFDIAINGYYEQTKRMPKELRVSRDVYEKIGKLTSYRDIPIILVED